jgi:hypothetical protein
LTLIILYCYVKNHHLSLVQFGFIGTIGNLRSNMAKVASSVDIRLEAPLTIT